MPFWIREPGAPGPDTVAVTGFDNSGGLDAAFMNGTYTRVTDLIVLNTIAGLIEGADGRYNPDEDVTEINLSDGVWQNNTGDVFIWNRRDDNTSQGGWHITRSDNTGVWAFQSSPSPQTSSINRSSTWFKTDDAASGVSQTVALSTATFNGASGNQIIENTPGAFLAESEVFHQLSSDGRMTPSMFPTLVSLGWHDFTIEARSVLSCRLNIDQTTADTDMLQENFASIEGLDIQRATGAAPFSGTTSGTGGITASVTPGVPATSSNPNTINVSSPSINARTFTIPAMIGGFTVNNGTTLNFTATGDGGWNVTRNGTRVHTVGSGGASRSFSIAVNPGDSIRTAGSAPSSGNDTLVSAFFGAGSLSGTTPTFNITFTNTNTYAVNLTAASTGGARPLGPAGSPTATAQVQTNGPANTYTIAGQLDAIPFDDDTSPTGGVTARVVRNGTTQISRRNISTLGGGPVTVNIPAGQSLEVEHAGDGGWRYQLNGGPVTNVGQNERRTFNGPATVVITSSGGMSAASSVTVGTFLGPAYDIFFDNTNPYAITLTAASTGGIRSLPAMSGEVRVQNGGTSTDFRIAGAPSTSTSYAAINESGVDLTVNGVSVPNNGRAVLPGTTPTLRIRIDETATNTITAIQQFRGFADQFQDAAGTNVATGLGEIDLVSQALVTSASVTGGGRGTDDDNGFDVQYLQSGVANLITILFPLNVSGGTGYPAGTLTTTAGFDVDIPVGAEPAVGEVISGQYGAGRSGSAVFTAEWRYEGGGVFRSVNGIQSGISTLPDRLGISVDRGASRVGFFSVTNNSGQTWDTFQLTVGGTTQTINDFVPRQQESFQFATTSQRWDFVAMAAGAGQNSHSVAINGVNIAGLEPLMLMDSSNSVSDSVNLPGTCTQVVTSRVYNNTGSTGERVTAANFTENPGVTITLTLGGNDGGTVREVANVYERIGNTIREVRYIYLPEPIPTGAPREVFGPRLNPLPPNTTIIPPNASRFNTPGPGSDLINPTASDPRCARDSSISKRWESTGGGCCDKKIYGARVAVAPTGGLGTALFQIQGVSFGRARFDIIGRSGCGNCCDCCQRQDVSTCFFLFHVGFQVPLDMIFDGDFQQNVTNPNDTAYTFNYNPAFDIANPTAIPALDWRTWSRSGCYVGPVGGDQISMEVQYNFNNPTMWRMTRAGNCKSCGSGQGDPWGPVTLFTVG